MGNYSVTIQGIDVLGLINAIDKINRQYIKITLNNIERVQKDNNLSEDEKYKLIRKYILDGFNDLSRTLVRVFLNDEDYRSSEDTK